MSIVVGIVAAFSRAQRQESTICNLIQIRETEAILRSAVLSQLSFLCVNLLLGKHLPAWAYALSLFAMASSMMVMRGVITRLLRRIHGAGYGADPVVIYGHSETTNHLATAMLRSPSCGLHPVAMIHDDSLKAADRMFRSKDGFCNSIPVSNGPLTSAKLNSFQCNLLDSRSTAPFAKRNRNNSGYRSSSAEPPSPFFLRHWRAKILWSRLRSMACIWSRECAWSPRGTLIS